MHTDKNALRAPTPVVRAALLSHAQALAKIGLRPVPMCAQQKRPARKGWRAALTLDPDAITAGLRAAPYADALGVATGGGVFVIDLDRNHADGADGLAAFADLLARQGDGGGLPLGPRVATPAGGLHLYFRAPLGRRIRNRCALAPGVDVRGDGGLAMVPPSGRGGVGYRWRPDPWTHPIPMAPDWLLALASPPAAAVRAFAPLRPFAGDVHPYAYAVLVGELAAVQGAPVGARNARLFRAAARLGGLAAGGALPVGAVSAGLLAAAAQSGLTADDGARAVQATIASGLNAGLERPRAVPIGGRRLG